MIYILKTIVELLSSKLNVLVLGGLSLFIIFFIVPEAQRDLVTWTGSTKLSEWSIVIQPFQYIATLEGLGTTVRKYYLFYVFTFDVAVLLIPVIFLAVLLKYSMRSRYSLLPPIAALTPFVAFALQVISSAILVIGTAYNFWNSFTVYLLWACISFKWGILMVATLLVCIQFGTIGYLKMRNRHSRS